MSAEDLEVRAATYSWDRRIYAAAHGSWPWDVDETDDGLDEVRGMLAEINNRAASAAPETSPAEPVLVDRDGDEWHWINGAYHSTSSPCTRAEVEQVWGPVTEKPAARAAT
ncbi:MAG TPA: hypothetical protein VIQ30_25820, partial [Pseudonocardia sp.]